MKTQFFILFFSFCVANIYSQIGINTASPLAELHITPSGSEDPLILSGIKSTNETNSIDGANANYLNLKISSNGVVRREVPPSPNQSAIVDLATTFIVSQGTSVGGGGNIMTWILANGTTSQYLVLPEDGAYVYSFRLYGSISTINSGATHYISSWKEGATTPFDIAEIYVTSVGASAATTVATYSVNLTVSGLAGDRVYFKISWYTNLGWRLVSSPGNNANKTSLLYWKL